jgi:hypothetical protein
MADVAALFLPLFDAIELPQRGVTRLFGSHASGDVLLDLALDVVPDFFIEFAICRRTAEQ